MDGIILSMDESVIRGCHPWMTFTDGYDGLRTCTCRTYSKHEDKSDACEARHELSMGHEKMLLERKHLNF